MPWLAERPRAVPELAAPARTALPSSAQHPARPGAAHPHAHAHRPWATGPAGGCWPARWAGGSTGGLGGSYLCPVPWACGSWPAGTAPVALTPRFESVQEAAYQRSCCCFLSLLLPHPGCRPHTYRPHLCSSALPGRLHTRPSSTPTSLGPAPVGTAWPPLNPGCLHRPLRWLLHALCDKPWPALVPPVGPGQMGETRLWGGEAGCFA